MFITSNSPAFNLAIDVMRHYVSAELVRAAINDSPLIPPVVFTVFPDGTYDLGVIPRDAGLAMLSGDGQPLRELLAQHPPIVLAGIGVVQDIHALDTETLEASTSSVFFARFVDVTRRERFAYAPVERYSNADGAVRLDVWIEAEELMPDMAWVDAARRAVPSN